jgi:D,D-heptose 1,7-bisphosphate phosphatase
MVKKKVAFLDRDGVINKKPNSGCYVLKKEDFVLNPGIVEVLQRLKEGGYEFILITNQRGISRGFFSEEDLAGIHNYMVEVLKSFDLVFLDILYCPHGHNECSCRKPKDGMLIKACSIYDIDIGKSILITDSIEEVEMGESFGINSYYVPTDQPGVFINEHKQ